jgi:hypothetical protein
MRYCKYCKRMVRGTKRLGVLSLVLMILLSGITFGLFLFFWIPWFLLVKKYACPICGSTELQKTMPEGVPS